MSKDHRKKNSSTTNDLVKAKERRQQEVVATLKAQIHGLNGDKQQLQMALIEKNKSQVEQQKTIAQRDAKIQKIEEARDDFKLKYENTLRDLILVKENFFKLETEYDEICKKKLIAFKNLEVELAEKSNEIKTITDMCDSMQKELHEEKTAHAKLNLDYSEKVNEINKKQQEIVRLQKNFENYIKQVEDSQKAYNERVHNEMSDLRREILIQQQKFEWEKKSIAGNLATKEELIEQCNKEKEALEQQKNLEIQELNYKISQIKKLSGQPTRCVTPMITIPETPQCSQQDETTVPKSDNVAIAKPQQRQEAANSKTCNKNKELEFFNQPREPANRLRLKKVSRIPYKKNCGASSSGVSKNDIISDMQTYSNPAPPQNKRTPAFSSSSDDDNDMELNIPQWAPNHFIPETETDASEDVCQAKRPRK